MRAKGTRTRTMRHSKYHPLSWRTQGVEESFSPIFWLLPKPYSRSNIIGHCRLLSIRKQPNTPNLHRTRILQLKYTSLITVFLFLSQQFQTFVSDPVWQASGAAGLATLGALKPAALAIRRGRGPATTHRPRRLPFPEDVSPCQVGRPRLSHKQPRATFGPAVRSSSLFMYRRWVICYWVECSRSVKLTVLISNRAVSLIGLLDIRAVNLICLFPFRKINLCPCQTGWRSAQMHYLEDVTSYYYKHDRNVSCRGKNCYQIRAVSYTGLLT